MAEIYIHSDHGEFPIKRLVSDNPRMFRIMRLFLIRVNGNITIIMPGFVLDFFSLPWFLFWYQPPATGEGVVASLDHDGKYAINWLGGRKQSDIDFRDIMSYDAYHVRLTKRWNMYYWVRGVSWKAWRDKSDEQIRHAGNFVHVVPENETEILEVLIRRGKVMEGILAEEYSYDEAMEQRLTSVGYGHIDPQLKGLDNG